MPERQDLTELLKDPVVQDVYQFLSENPNPPDEAFHAWAESAGYQPDEAESAAYTLATKLVEFLNEGKAEEEELRPSDTDPKNLTIGKQIEKEHTSDEGIRSRIAADHLAEDPEYYTKPEHLDFEEEAKKQAMLRACYLVGMKRAYDARGIKFAAGSGSSLFGGLGGVPKVILQTGDALRNAMGNIVANNGKGAPSNVWTGLLTMLRGASQAEGASEVRQKQVASATQPQQNVKTGKTNMYGTAPTIKSSPWGSAAQGKPPKITPTSAPVAPTAVAQTETPQQPPVSNPPVTSMHVLPGNKTLTASWNKFAQELASGGSSTSGGAPLYNGVDQKPVTLATPEPAMPPSRPVQPQGNSLYDMFSSKFPNPPMTGQDADSNDADEDPQGYALRQPQGLTNVTESPMAPQVGT